MVDQWPCIASRVQLTRQFISFGLEICEIIEILKRCVQCVFKVYLRHISKLCHNSNSFRNVTCVDNIFKINISFRLVLSMNNKQLRSNMQQLVSYQTARRIYGERSYKKYVTKRTCISLTFSIAFFTLIIGKLWSGDYI